MSGRTSLPIYNLKGHKSQYVVIKHHADQPIEVAPEDGLISSASCAEITTQAFNLQPVSNPPTVSSTYAADNTLLHFYEASMDTSGWEEIINLIMIEKEQVAEAFYCPSVGDCDANSLQDHTSGDGENHQTTVEKKKLIGKSLKFKDMNSQFAPDSDMEVPRGKVHTGHGKMKKRQTDQCGSESVMKTYVQVSAQKGHLKESTRAICKSSIYSNGSCKDHEEKSNPKFYDLRGDSAELLRNTVDEEAKAESPKDYIHVRARRGQATDRHSLAERARRERISKRMKNLQNFVPGCNKITGKALMLEEIINYIQYLQKQVEILSMKVAYVVPFCDFELQINGNPSEEIEDIRMA